ncbi:hypothetical protein QVA72_01515 [Staphylococcus simulans]|uniref:hypothetical protein n=1 Tax=Staphylococcus simulans TaxID=1286 RepID=UPI000E685D98|nr:hypothetical protein [Staphylococcus simulans]MDU0420323.1 hypothetical protein [Staphylococcus simulans]MDU0466182.1 hypothetical protein [Staphylococcus simulans]RIN48941.1 hypothetical protein BU041_10000 [Staphylococcus simulans]
MEENLKNRIEQQRFNHQKLVMDITNSILNESETYKSALNEVNENIFWNLENEQLANDIEDEIYRRMKLEAPSKRG